MALLILFIYHMIRCWILQIKKTYASASLLKSVNSSIYLCAFIHRKYVGGVHSYFGECDQIKMIILEHILLTKQQTIQKNFIK